MLEKIKEAIREPLEKMDIVVDDISFDKEGSYYFLRITLDKINGIDLDTIVEATNVINPILDKLDLIEDKISISKAKHNQFLKELGLPELK